MEHEHHAQQQQEENFQYQELFEHLHMFQLGPKKGGFVSERSKKALEDVSKLKEKYTQSSSSSHSVENAATIPNDKELFAEICGGFKKGRVFGLGSESSSVKSKSITTVSSTIALEVEKLQKELSKVVENHKQTQIKYRQRVKKYKERETILTNYLQVLA